MFDHWDYLRAALQNNYAFREMSVVQETPLLVQTERGIKKIRFWDDERLLSEHLNWRRKLISDSFFLDRMYATVYGATSIRFDRYMITCHDAPLDQAPIAGKETQWAGLVALLLKKSRGNLPPVAASQVSAQAAYFFSESERVGMVSDTIGQLVRTCYPSVQSRAEIADRLRNQHRSGSKAFILPEDFSFQSTRLLLETLFFELGQSRPVSGYRQLAQFILLAALEQGEETVQKLLEALAPQFSLERETQDLLLAEWYEPGEWFRLFAAANAPIAAPEEHDLFKKVWDAKTRLIRHVQSVWNMAEMA